MPERRPDAEQGLAAGGVAADLRVVGTEGDQVGHEHRDRDDVVGDRRPHHRAEPAAGVEDLADQDVHPVEEDLRQAVAGEVDDRLLRVRRPAGIDEQPHQPWRADDQEHRDRAEEERGEGDHPVRVGLAPVRVVGGRADQLRHEHGVEDAAGQQDVEHVRDGVGDREHVGVDQVAQRRGQQDRADVAGQPGHDRARGHHRAVGEDPLVLGGLGDAHRRAARTRRTSRKRDRPEQQPDPCGEEQPDHVAHPGGPDGQLVGATQGLAVLVGDHDRHVVDAGLVGARVEEDGGTALGQDVDLTGRGDLQRTGRTARRGSR